MRRAASVALRQHRAVSRGHRAIEMSVVRRHVSTTDQGVVCLDYEDLVKGRDLSAAVHRAYGYDGIGLLVVSNVPNFVQYRGAFLPYASRLAQLSPAQLQALEDADSNYSVGWSHGKEEITPGQPDVYKGSYYFNPTYDVPSDDPELIKQFPESLLPNVWPDEALPDFEACAKDLGRLIVDTGVLVAKQCDTFVQQHFPDQRCNLADTIRSSRSTKARLLHYFDIPEDQVGSDDSNWCAWHNDHGSLTGLCSAMFMPAGSVDAKDEMDNPDASSGLFARTRSGEEVRVMIPRDCLAFQIGESSQIQSGGKLRATPHSVMAATTPGIVRNTFAVFMQPNFDVCLDPPPGCSDEDASCSRWRRGMTFGDFSKATIEAYATGKL